MGAIATQNAPYGAGILPRRLPSDYYLIAISGDCYLIYYLITIRILYS